MLHLLSVVAILGSLTQRRSRLVATGVCKTNSSQTNEAIQITSPVSKEAPFAK